jgi:hypothetical protein
LSKSNRNKTLFGLRTNKAIKIKYDISSESISGVEGIDNIDSDEIEISERKGFNLPLYILVSGVPYYPSKYEFLEGEVFYHSRQPPFFPIKINAENEFLECRSKEMKARITLEMLEEFDKSQKKRPRKPTQIKVMNESAKDHVASLVNRGLLTVPDDINVQWHWCHLVAFTMLPSKRAQAKKNLVVGTAACNGHMANIEASVKSFIYEVKRPVSLEVTATHLADSHLASRIRDRVWEPKSQMLYVEYFDALTAVKSDYADYENIYEKLMSEYQQACNK